MNTQHLSFNPFPGLRPFRQDEDYLFFGREDQTMELLQRLGSNRFVAVVGTSGSGKSSLVRCGLLSELLGGKMLRAGSSWEIAVSNPGGNPFGLLAEALLEADLYDRDEENAGNRLLATLTRSHFGLVEAVKQARLTEGTNFLLVVDQFEEIFRFNEAGQTEQDVANEFVSVLLEAVSQSEVPIYVVITMRSDFIGDCGQFEGLAEMVNRGEFLIPRLTREQYKRVIEAPIKVAGGEITPRLLQRLLNDLGQQADQLPCLQHALMRTWTIATQHGESTPLDLDDYRQIGGMSQALSLHADEVYESLENDLQRSLCTRIFQSLTVQESENRGIRRPQRLGSLSKILDVEPSELAPIIDAYRQHGVTFLMPSPEVALETKTIIDISHESLMRVWTRLRQWVDEEYQAAGIYRRLSESADLFEHGKAGLYRNPELGIALSWRETRKPNEAWANRYHDGFAAAMDFLEKSLFAAEQAERDREAARERDLEQAKKLAEAQRLRAEEQRRAAVRLRWLAGALAGGVTVALVAFVFAAMARTTAEENERLAVDAQSRALASAETTQLALEKAKVARDEAERSKEDETIQRKAAEEQRANAVRIQKQLETTLTKVDMARQEAEEQRANAVRIQKQLEATLTKVDMARQEAENEKLAADKSAELAKRRENLFENLLPLLEKHACEGVDKIAKKLESDGKSREALDTYADFCNLVLGENNEGFLAGELLNLDSLDLQGIDSESISIEISVPPLSLFADVLTPAIELGERQVANQSDKKLQQLVAALHTYRARLLRQHPNHDWPPNTSPAKLVFDSFDRAATLEPDQFEHFLGRAGARFRLPDKDFGSVLADLDSAIRLYPNPPEPVDEPAAVTEIHHDFSQLLHARANVLEYLAMSNRTVGQNERLIEAERFHRQAHSLDPENPTYMVSIARTLRKQAVDAKPGPSSDNLAAAEKLLRETLKLSAEYPEAHNGLGEVFLAQGRIADSRGAFESAVKYGEHVGHKRNLYMFCCNLANAYSRDPTDESTYSRALEAAEQAIALQPDSAVDGHYYRGFALWKLERTNDALLALSEAIKLGPKHVDAVLTRCQILIEMKEPNPPTNEQLSQAYTDARAVLDYTNLTKDEKSKAYYVNSVAWLGYHIQQKSEDALVKCLDFALKAAQGSSAYLAFANEIGDFAAKITWRNSQLQSEATRLRQALKAIPGTNGAAAGGNN